MQNSAEVSSSTPRGHQRPGEVNASLLVAVALVLVGTGLTAAAFLASTQTGQLRGMGPAAQQATALPAPAPLVAPLGAPAATPPVAPIGVPCEGPACAGAASPVLKSTQPS